MIPPCTLALSLNHFLRLAPQIFLLMGEKESPDAKEKGTEITYLAYSRAPPATSMQEGGLSKH
jgi:hypothetical protein